MNHAFSQIEEAFRATLIHKATGRDHDAIAVMLGLPRPRGFPESDWVNAIHVLGYGARGHPRAVFRFIEMALRRFERDEIESRPVEVQAGQLSRLYQGTGTVFNKNYLGRVFRINGVLYRTSQEYAVDWTWVGLERATSEFSAFGADFTPGAYAARFLPFRIREATGGPNFEVDAFTGLSTDQVSYCPGTGVVYEVLLYPDQFSTVPPTYLRADPVTDVDAGSGAVVDANGVALGGHVTADSTYTGHVEGAAFPLYLDNGRRMREFEAVLDEVLAAGVKAEIKLDMSIW